MTEPIITINGVALIESQAMAVRVAITSFHQKMVYPGAPLGTSDDDMRLKEAYRDRLTEVVRIMAQPATARSQNDLVVAKVLTNRAARIMQLAGLVPEQATPQQRHMAETYAITVTALDEAAIRFKKAAGL